jgi:hypothetical protein
MSSRLAAAAPSRSSFRSRCALVALATLAVAAPAAAVKRLGFVTSVSGTGLIASWPASGGQHALVGADNICQARAALGGLPNAATYRAWLSTAGTDAYCHVQGRSGKRSTGCSGLPQPAGPWYQVGTLLPFAGALDDLTGPEGVIVRGVVYDEFGNAPGQFDPSDYWTGTLDTGEVAASTCSSWVVAASDVQGQIGDGLATAEEWTDDAPRACNTPRRLLCLEPGESEEIPATAWSPAAIVFVTSETGNADLSSWPEAGGEEGIAAGDAVCRNLATAAHLPAPESFVAWLSDSSTDARDRLTLDDVPYRRLDDFRVASSKADLLTFATGNTNSLHVDELGNYLTGQTLAFTASDHAGVYMGYSCLDWSLSTGGSNVFAGNASRLRTNRWTAHAGVACVNTWRLYCFSNVVTLFWDGFDRTEDTSRWSVTTP